MPVRTLVALLGIGAASILAQPPASSGNEVQIILTSADHMNHHPPSLKAADLTVADATVTSLSPIESGRNLELYIVIDDAADYDLGPKLGELRRFIAAQPESAAIGVAYLHDGALRIAEEPTLDHKRAANSLRAPSGGKTATPDCGISDVMDVWRNRAAATRREIVLLTNGAICANADTAIQVAERAGVVLYALYNPVRNYASENWSDVDAGIVHLAHVSYETGGEAYFTGHGPAVSFVPYLGDIAEHLANQYTLKFRLSGGPEGGFYPLHINSKSTDDELMAPAAVWVPTAAAATGGN